MIKFYKDLHIYSRLIRAVVVKLVYHTLRDGQPWFRISRLRKDKNFLSTYRRDGLQGQPFSYRMEKGGPVSESIAIGW
jgi:hypothetical protein